MTRRDFIAWSGSAVLGLCLSESGDGNTLELFLAGDLMAGRGIDQILPHSVAPQLHEPYVKDARRYVELAEARNGEIDRPVSYRYPWGDALEVLDHRAPHLRIVNLETSLTTSGDRDRAKGIHYRMHPRNVELLSVAGIDACTLANNHVLDWGERGLLETLETLEAAGIPAAGAGRDLAEALEPAVLDAPGRRVLVFSYGTPDAGVPAEWQATIMRPGVNVIPRLTPAEANQLSEYIASYRRPDDFVVLSLHWGGNWGYEVPDRQREFAHALIDSTSVDVIHGHSSHHPKGIEVYRDRLILYGAGDLLNDYEGIGGREEFRSEIVLLYFPCFDARNRLRSLEMVPMRLRRLQLQGADEEEREWVARRMDRESRKFGAGVDLSDEGVLALVRRDSAG